MLKLIAIVGTNSKRSTNRQLLQYMQKHFADKAEIELVEIKDLPVFNKPADKLIPAEALEIAAKIEKRKADSSRHCRKNSTFAMTKDS